MTYTPAGTVEPWSGLAVAISADRMLVTSEGAALLLRLVGVAERLARRDGIGLSPQLASVRDVLRAVASSSRTSADVRDDEATARRTSRTLASCGERPMPSRRARRSATPTSRSSRAAPSEVTSIRSALMATASPDHGSTVPAGV